MRSGFERCSLEHLQAERLAGDMPHNSLEECDSDGHQAAHQNGGSQAAVRGPELTREGKETFLAVHHWNSM